MDPTPDTPDQTESSSGEDSGSEDGGVMGEGEQEIQVEFEARTPEERDLPGIISLLRQCFRGSDEIDVSASDPRGQLSRLLSSPDIDIGLIISERIINMPPQISVPLYQTLSNEVRKARAKNLPFNFTHYLLISKVLLPSVELQPQAGVMYANAEEEVFIPECDLVLDMKVNSNMNDQEARVVTISQEELVERKKVLVFKAERLDKIVGLVKNAFPIS